VRKEYLAKINNYPNTMVRGPMPPHRCQADPGHLYHSTWATIRLLPASSANAVFIAFIRFYEFIIFRLYYGFSSEPCRWRILKTQGGSQRTAFFGQAAVL